MSFNVIYLQLRTNVLNQRKNNYFNIFDEHYLVYDLFKLNNDKKNSDICLKKFLNVEKNLQIDETEGN